MIRKHIFLIFILLQSSFVFAQFNPKQEADIQKKARKLLDEYALRFNKLGREVKMIDQTRLNIEDFLELFVSRKIQIYNDLDPTHTLSEYYEAETYASNVTLWYPSGISIKLLFTEAQVSNIISHGEGVYSIDYIIDKQTTGNYLGKTPNNSLDKLQFRIAFTLAMGDYTKFKIAGIRNSSEKKEITDSKEILQIKSAVLTDNEKREIDRETKTVLNDYANYLSLIGDTLENIEEKMNYKTSFKSLFMSDHSAVFNDILPESKKQFVPVSDYITLYSEAYAADGGTVTFELDSADLGIIIKKTDSLYYRNTEVNKFFTGNYLGKRKVILNNRVSLRIVFQRSGRLFKNFRIDRIDQVSQKKAEVIEQRTFTYIQKQKGEKKKDDQKAALKPLKISKSKVTIVVGATGNMTNLISGSLNQVTKEKSGYSWTTTPMFGYRAYAHYLYMLTPNMSLLTGIGYSTAATKYSVEDNAITDIHDNVEQPYSDSLGGIYYKRIFAKFDSTVNLSFINIPIGVRFNFNLSRKTDFFFEPVINLSFVNKATSKFDGPEKNGYKTYYAYYKDQKDIFHPEVLWPTSLQTRQDWPEFGVYNYYGPRTDTIKEALNYLHVIADISFGIKFKLSSHIAFAITSNIQYGLNDLNNTKPEYNYDFFGETEQTATGNLVYGQSRANLEHVNNSHQYKYKPTRLFSYGAGAEFVVKF